MLPKVMVRLVEFDLALWTVDLEIRGRSDHFGDIEALGFFKKLILDVRFST